MTETETFTNMEQINTLDFLEGTFTQPAGTHEYDLVMSSGKTVKFKSGGPDIERVERNIYQNDLTKKTDDVTEYRIFYADGSQRTIFHSTDAVEETVIIEEPAEEDGTIGIGVLSKDDRLGNRIRRFSVDKVLSDYSPIAYEAFPLPKYR